ncbi:hypothetical protein [Burkholderia ubonensis]|uniref:hypothetical protein n=1 Tax=Burkholderia ubonensis TaxID=101571 RepID=UPI000B221027|nr:hypothetical protein [Burkholderia ubonensis]
MQTRCFSPRRRKRSADSRRHARPARWHPFAPGGQSLKSQLCAVRTVRAAFEWLTKVCYLAGNPCAAVTDPKPVKRARKLQIERAL